MCSAQADCSTKNKTKLNKMYRLLASQILTILFALLLLSGCLPTIFAGAAGSAFALAKDRPIKEAVSDTYIANSIKAQFIKDGFNELYTKIKVEVITSRVLLTGIIDKEEDAINAVKICWNQKGVKEVVNELKVDQNSHNFDLVQYTRDTLITTQIKSKTFLDRSIKFINYTIITLNDIVYLFGLARSESELEKVAQIAANIHGVKKVISHVSINPVEKNHKQMTGSVIDENDDSVQVINDE